MGSVFKSFQRSPLGAFVRSPLGVRNGADTMILWVSFVSADYTGLNEDDRDEAIIRQDDDLFLWDEFNEINGKADNCFLVWAHDLEGTEAEYFDNMSNFVKGIPDDIPLFETLQAQDMTLKGDWIEKVYQAATKIMGTPKFVIILIPDFFSLYIDDFEPILREFQSEFLLNKGVSSVCIDANFGPTSFGGGRWIADFLYHRKFPREAEFGFQTYIPYDDVVFGTKEHGKIVYDFGDP